MVSVGAKARHTIGRRLGVCMAEAEPLNRRNRLRGSFHAANFVGYTSNAIITVYFMLHISSAALVTLAWLFILCCVFYRLR